MTANFWTEFAKLDDIAKKEILNATFEKLDIKVDADLFITEFENVFNALTDISVD